jgi:chaperonin GroES
MLIDAGRDISGVKDVLMGEVPSSNIAQGTVLAMIEQGMKQFTAIYKRMHAALKSEFRKIFLLNRAHLDDREYALFHGETGPEIYAADYQAPPEHITPFSDPTQVTPLQAMARAEYLNGFLGRPSVNERAITRRQLEAAGIDDVEDLMAPEDGPPPPQVVLALREAVAKVQKLYAEIGRLEAQRVEQMTKSVKNVADAEAAEVGVQLDSYRAEVGDIRAAAEIVDRARQSEQQAEGGGA